MRTNRVEKIRVNLSTIYELMMGQCTGYLGSRLENQNKWETMSYNSDILAIIGSKKCCPTNTMRTQSTIMCPITR